jgi:hypothetical protein
MGIRVVPFHQFEESFDSLLGRGGKVFLDISRIRFLVAAIDADHLLHDNSQSTALTAPASAGGNCS